MRFILLSAFVAYSFNALAIAKEFVIETKIDEGSQNATSYRIRVAEGEEASLSTYGEDPSTRTTLKVSAVDLGDDDQGEGRVQLRFNIQRSTPEKTIEDTPQITALIGKPTVLEIGQNGHEPLRMQVKALRR